MRRAVTGLGLLAMGLVAGCGSSGAVAPPRAAAPQAARVEPKPVASAPDDDPLPSEPPPGTSGAWVGAATESDWMLRTGGESYLGVWVDAPRVKPRVRAPVDLAIVIDTSGSMRGEKIENARSAARALVSALVDGDIVSLDTFSERAQVLVAPTVIDMRSRARILSTIDELTPAGATNMFHGLSLAEGHLASAPADHPVRRVVMISDGIANVGPSTPEDLGALAERGLRFRAQVTSLGVGNDYDEHTLNALAVRTSGRMFHLSDPREMASILKREGDLLGATVASDAYVEVVPATGVQIVAADPNVHFEWAGNGAVRIPLGALFAGQHREALLRVRVGALAAGSAQSAIASVRLHFHDPSDGDLDRVQEVVARVQPTDDASAVTAHANPKTAAIVAVLDAAKLEMQAAQHVNQGQFADADARLAAAEDQLRKGAALARDEGEKKRLDKAAASVAQQRAATHAAAAAPPAAQRDQALRLNSGGMKDAGF